MSSKKVATIDLGSNSFHMLISEIYTDGEIKELYRGKSKVQLRSGLTEAHGLTDEAQERALECLENFTLSLKHYQVDEVKVVGTYTLRKAKENIATFLKRAEQILEAKVEVISGEEEARLVYVGASANTKAQKKKALIVDIGGGSTELVIGKNQDLKALVSLEMGCVSMQNKFFADGLLTLSNFTRAIQHACQLIEPIANEYLQHGWEMSLGSSGTIRSIADVALANNYSDGAITREVMEALAVKLLEKKVVANIHFNGLRQDRESILAGGFCVLYALFDRLNIKKMLKSDGALREGMLYEIVNNYH
ncbi:Ppx/GppA family phosphatase [Fangia hongkongensis]|uniref:Ppx/GppA family phosphatase n=1 Tax=Fangia hongkongensis TaxID=270495 RepID=UPI00037D7482|nr:Ppx/GppA family phosphatase [Fangia hongkongensis]MBK2125639.1 Ppx/GppA family phosphatase [Fangia hongkongensis]